MQHARFLEFLERLRRKDHRGIVLAPGLLGLDNVVANRFVADEQPRFIDQECFEGAELGGIGDFVARPVQDVEQQRFQNLGRISPAGEIEGLETAEGQRVFGIIEEESVLPLPGPAVQPVLELAQDVGEV